MMHSSSLSGAEMGDVENNFSSFMNKSVRLAFIRKVYGIISVQTFVAFAFVLLLTLNEAREWAKNTVWLMYVAMAVSIGTMLLLACTGLHRSYPANYILLALYTLSTAVIISFVGAIFDKNVVIVAIGITFFVVLGLTLFAFQTKIDFTPFNGIMFVVLLVFVLIGFVACFFREVRGFNLFYSGFGVLIFSIYLVIDTQMIVGGKRQNEFSPEDYIFAAISIFADIVNLFLYILRFVAEAKQ